MHHGIPGPVKVGDLWHLESIWQRHSRIGIPVLNVWDGLYPLGFLEQLFKLAQLQRCRVHLELKGRVRLIDRRRCLGELR